MPDVDSLASQSAKVSLRSWRKYLAWGFISPCRINWYLDLAAKARLARRAISLQLAYLALVCVTLFFLSFLIVKCTCVCVDFFFFSRFLMEWNHFISFVPVE